MTWAWTKAGPLPAAAMSGGAHECRITDDGIGAVELLEMEVGEAADQSQIFPPAVWTSTGNGDGVLVVFNDEEQRQLHVGGEVQRFPEFTFAGGAVAEGDVGDFIAMKDTSLNWR